MSGGNRSVPFNRTSIRLFSHDIAAHKAAAAAKLTMLLACAFALEAILAQHTNVAPATNPSAR